MAAKRERFSMSAVVCDGGQLTTPFKKHLRIKCLRHWDVEKIGVPCTTWKLQLDNLSVLAGLSPAACLISKLLSASPGQLPRPRGCKKLLALALSPAVSSRSMKCLMKSCSSDFTRPFQKAVVEKAPTSLPPYSPQRPINILLFEMRTFGEVTKWIIAGTTCIRCCG